jgi:hypothetical protein
MRLGCSFCFGPLCHHRASDSLATDDHDVFDEARPEVRLDYRVEKLCLPQTQGTRAWLMPQCPVDEHVLSATLRGRGDPRPMGLLELDDFYPSNDLLHWISKANADYHVLIYIPGDRKILFKRPR